jgi:hypothetical protein
MRTTAQRTPTNQMRCALFHGELVPAKDATAYYEQRYLSSIT